MGRWKSLAGATCATMVLSLHVAGAQGVLPDRMTYVTFDAPVSIPGAVLPAGEYMFRLADTQANRDVVQIYERDGSKLHAMLITVRAERDRIEGDPVITFRETPADQPPAIRYWFFAGERSGQEFAYPRNQAEQIARASGESVLAFDADMKDDQAMKTADISRVDGSEQRADAAGAMPEAATRPVTEEEAAAAATRAETAAADETAPSAESQRDVRADAQQPAATETARANDAPAAAATTGRTSEPGAVGTSGQQVPAPAATNRRELPRTATALPLVGLAGLLALGAAAGVRVIRRRR